MWLSMSTIWAFDDIENNHYLYRSENCMKTFREYLKQHVMEIINFEEKEMIPLRNKEHKSYINQKFVTVAKKSSRINMLMIRNIVELKISAILRIFIFC